MSLLGVLLDVMVAAVAVIDRRLEHCSRRFHSLRVLTAGNGLFSCQTSLDG